MMKNICMYHFHFDIKGFILHFFVKTPHCVDHDCFVKPVRGLCNSCTVARTFACVEKCRTTILPGILLSHISDFLSVCLDPSPWLTSSPVRISTVRRRNRLPALGRSSQSFTDPKAIRAKATRATPAARSASCCVTPSSKQPEAAKHTLTLLHYLNEVYLLKAWTLTHQLYFYFPLGQFNLNLNCLTISILFSLFTTHVVSKHFTRHFKYSQMSQL